MSNLGEKVLGFTTCTTAILALAYFADLIPMWVALIPVGLIIAVFVGLPTLIGLICIVALDFYFIYVLFSGRRFFIEKNTEDNGDLNIDITIPTGTTELTTEEIDNILNNKEQNKEDGKEE